MRRLEIVLLTAVVACSGTFAQTIYKHVDKDGRVTYTDKPPGKDQTVQKIEIDTGRNIVTPLGDNPARAKEDADAAVRTRGESAMTREAAIAEAEAKLAQAREALASQQPGDDDYRTIGTGKGRPARVPTDAYLESIRRLENAIKQAEEELDKARSAPAARPQGARTDAKSEN